MAATISYSYKWFRTAAGGSPVAITGATQPTYTLQTADVNCKITCQVTAIDSAGSTIATTAPTPVITPATTLSTPVLPPVPTPNVVPTKINNTWSGTGEPSPYILVNSAKYMNVFPAGTSPALTLSASGATNWTCKDIYNNTSTGTISGTSFTPTPPAGGSSWLCGWYRITLTKSSQNLANWGQQCGDGSFFIMNDGVANLPGPSQFPNGVSYSDTSYGTWCPPFTAACGNIGSRWSITNTQNPSAGTTGPDPFDATNTGSVVGFVAYDANWFLKYGTANRPHQDFISWPNGTVDVVNVLTNTPLTTLGSGSAFAMLVKSSTEVFVSSTVAGTVHITTTSGGTAVETWTGTTWGALVSAINAGSKYVVAYSSSPSSNATTFAQASIINTAFVAIASVVSAVNAQAVTSGVTCPAFEGPYNEPDDDPVLCAAQMVAFKAACRSAFSGAIVIGPMPVTFNNAMIPWIKSFFTAAVAIGYSPDGLSFHTYNTVNGDIELCDQVFPQLKSALAAAGFSSVPLWMTEGDGTLPNNYGSISWRNFTHWIALRTLMYETYGLPLQRQSYYYMSSMGYSAFPAYLKTGGNQAGPSCHPAFSMWRGFMEHTANATPPTRLTMPAAAQHLFFGSVYNNADPAIAKPLSAGRFGVFIPNDGTAGVITAEENNIGRPFDVVLDFYNWNNGTSAIPTISSSILADVGTRDYVMTLQPSSGPNGATTANCVQWQPLIAGTYDAQIIAFANWINTNVASGAIKGQFYVRFAHEANGSGFYDWQVGGSCGVTSAANYIAGFNHFASVLKANTTHAKVIWAANAGPNNNIGTFYPSGCDVMAFDSYNYGTNGPSSTVTDWLTDSDLYPVPYAAVAACDPVKPIWITETACSEPSVSWTYQGTTYPAEPGFSKATWVTNMLANTSYPRITTVIWFDIQKERNFTITSSPGSTTAFHNALTPVTGANGNVVVALITAGQPSGTVVLSFSSSVTATVYDWAGNTISTSSGSTLSVSVSDLPTYVVAPSGVTVTVADVNNGLAALSTNIASSATIASSVPPTTNNATGTPGAASTLINGTFETGTYFNDGNGGPAEYRSSTAPPVWFVLEWPEIYSINRVLLFAAPGWQNDDAPIQYNIYTWSGTAWILQNSYTNTTASSVAVPTGNETWQSFSEQYWDGAHNFDINLGGIQSNAVRVDILNVSYGSDPDNAGGSPNAGQDGPSVCLREIQVYGTPVVTPPPPTFTADSPPTTATEGVAYSYQLVATGATSFAINTGSPPTGITVSSAGLISGTPTASGSFSFTVNAIGTFGTTVSPTFNITVPATSTSRFIGYTMDLTNRNGMVGKNLTSSDAITPRTNFPGGSTAAANQNLPCNFEGFTDYLAAFPWPAIIGCFMNTADKFTMSNGVVNQAPLYFGAGANTTASQGGYPTFQGQLTNPAGLTGSPFINSPYKNPDGSPALAAIPIISWDLGSNSLAGIASGSFDASTIIPAALACKAWQASAGNPAFGTQPGGQVIIRLMHEFNGTWSGYCPGNTTQPSNTTAATFVAAWQHIVQVFAAQGATNARWHWCPNVFGSAAGTNAQSGWSTGSGTVALMYPGDNYVDYVGLDGYNYTNNSPNWQTFAQVFQNSYNGIYNGDSHTIIPGKTTAGPISSKPMILGEIGCWETDEMKNVPSGASKGKWFTDMITTVQNSMPKIQGICWWYENPGAAGNQTSLEYYLTSSASSAAGWNTVAHTWTGRPPVIQGVTATH